jgi:hypothetical protein
MSVSITSHTSTPRDVRTSLASLARTRHFHRLAVVVEVLRIWVQDVRWDRCRRHDKRNCECGQEERGEFHEGLNLKECGDFASPGSDVAGAEACLARPAVLVKPPSQPHGRETRQVK